MQPVTDQAVMSIWNGERELGGWKRPEWRERVGLGLESRE